MRLPLLGLLVFALTACAPATPTPLSAEQIAQNAAEKSAGVSSFHFTIDLSGRPKTIDAVGTLALRHAEGDVVRPDRAQSKIKVALSGVIVEIQAIGIGNQQWLTNPLSQKWEQVPSGWGYNPAVLFDPQQGIASLLSRVKGLTRAEDDNLAGTPLYRLTGNIAGAEVAPMTANMVTGSDASFTLWIGSSDFLLRKVHISEKYDASSETTEWDITLSSFNQPITITAPSL